MDLAEQNARHLLEEFRLAGLEADERAADPVYELQRELGLSKVPRGLVCFDISTAQGTDNVASIVWFENGRPKRAEYRKLKIQTVEGTDDFASMREVVTRYFRRRVDEKKPLPDLVVVDGGKGQLGVAREALDALGLAENGAREPRQARRGDLRAGQAGADAPRRGGLPRSGCCSRRATKRTAPPSRTIASGARCAR